MPCSLTRAIAFHATHRYPGGVAHGHLYQVAVTVTGALDPTTRMVMALDRLDEILTEGVTVPLGGRHLHEVVPAFASGAQWPTCEAIAEWGWRAIATSLPAGVQLERVRVAEDETLWADCTGIA